MYNLASKLLAPLFDPLTLAILLAFCALLAWRYRRLAIRLLIVSVVPAGAIMLSKRMTEV